MPAATLTRADRYDDDPNYNYVDYWNGRAYEHAAEVMAIRRLLGSRRFCRAVDVGGGFGRLASLLTTYAGTVVLAEPSRHQLELAEHFLGEETRIERRQVPAADLGLPAGSVDLLLLVRVLHHIPDPRAEFAEFARVVQPGGTLVLEFANSANLVSRLRLAAASACPASRCARSPGPNTASGICPSSTIAHERSWLSWTAPALT